MQLLFEQYVAISEII